MELIKPFEFYYNNIKQKYYYKLTIKEYEKMIKFENIKIVDEYLNINCEECENCYCCYCCEKCHTCNNCENSKQCEKCENCIDCEDCCECMNCKNCKSHECKDKFAVNIKKSNCLICKLLYFIEDRASDWGGYQHQYSFYDKNNLKDSVKYSSVYDIEYKNFIDIHDIDKLLEYDELKEKYDKLYRILEGLDSYETINERDLLSIRKSFHLIINPNDSTWKDSEDGSESCDDIYLD